VSGTSYATTAMPSRLARRPQGAGRRLITGLLVSVVAVLLNGICLMVLVPLAHEVVGTPLLRPGYWPCVAAVLLARTIVRGMAAES
jgi:hypothetical protein